MADINIEDYRQAFLAQLVESAIPVVDGAIREVHQATGKSEFILHGICVEND